MLGRENDSQCLPVATGVTHKFSVKSADIILCAAYVPNGFIDFIIQVFSKMFQRSLFQFRLDFIQFYSILDKCELTKDFIFLDFW